MIGSRKSTSGRIRPLIVALSMLAWIACVAPFARAADAPAKAVNYMYISTASFKEMGDAAAQIGIPIGPQMTAAGLGEQFPFVGKDGIDDSRPAGIVIFVDTATQTFNPNNVIIVLPVKANAATVAQLTAINGATPIAGQPECIQLKDMTFRRTADDLIFGAAADAVTSLSTSDLTDPYKANQANGKVLADIRIDVKTLRAAAPKLVDQLVQGMMGGPAPENTPDRMMQDWATGPLAKIDNIHASLSQTGEKMELLLAVSKADLTSAGKFPNPQMPANATIRFDCTSPEVKQSFATLSENLTLSAAKDKKLTDDQTKLVKSAVQAVNATLLDEPAVSVGIVPEGDATRVYVVEQREQPFDASAAFQKNAKLIQATMTLMDGPNEKSSVEFSEYEDNGAKISRLKFSDHGKAMVYVDAIAKGKMVYIVGAGEDGHHTGDVSGLGTKGEFTDILNASVDMEPMFQQMVKQRPPLPADKLKSITDALKGQMLTLSMTANNGAATIKVDAATSVIKTIVGIMNGPGGEPPAMAPAPEPGM